jgi:outer membrane protein OmpA-like peptidoglycan-associated protein
MSVKKYATILFVLSIWQYASGSVHDAAGHSASIYQKDIAIIKKILQTKDKDKTSLERIVKLLFATENFDETIQYCDKYLKYYVNSEIMYIKAISLANISKYTDAIAVMNIILNNPSLSEKDRKDFEEKRKVFEKSIVTRGEPAEGKKTVWGADSFAAGVYDRDYSLIGIDTVTEKIFRYSFKDSSRKAYEPEQIFTGLEISKILFISISPNGREVYATLTGLNGSLETVCRTYDADSAVWTPWSTPAFAVVGTVNGFANMLGDNEHVLFVSNRDARNGLDMYSVRRNEHGAWEEPKKISNVNTVMDECSLYVHPDGETVYFSTNGRGGCGGYDLFAGKLSSLRGNFSIGEIVNLTRINTFRNESLPLFTTIKGDAAFYTYKKSDRENIYELAAIEALPNQAMFFDCTVLDAATKKPVKAVVSLVRSGDRTSGISLMSPTCNKGIAPFTVRRNSRYTISVIADGYPYFTESFDMPAGTDSVSKTVYLERGKIKTGFSFIADNIYFDPGLFVIREESLPALERLFVFMKSNPGIKIEIAGHTDNTGSYAYNMELSLKRARSVADFIVAKGIKKDRVSTKGYGYEQGAATNETEEGRQKNRRVEITVLSSE